MNRKALFALTFLFGIFFSGWGINLLFFQVNDSNTSQIVDIPTDSRATFSYLPTPAPGENNPMLVNAELFLFVNGTRNSSLDLRLAGGFVSAPSQVSFLFESSFNVTIVKQNNGSGDGNGIWKRYPIQTSNGRLGTTIQYLFNRTGPANRGTSFTGVDASLGLIGLPYISEPGKYTAIFPFSTLAAGQPATNGFFTVCPPMNYLLTSANQPYETPPSACPSGLRPYQFRINQSLQLVMTFEDSNLERAYSHNQTFGLFFLGIGVPLIVSSVAFLDSGLESKVDELTKLTKEISEKLHGTPKSNRRRRPQASHLHVPSPGETRTIQGAAKRPARKET
jgi:hypothetical protein